MAKLAAVWNKAFASGSKSLQDRLKKVHANNPEFQSWLKSSGHGAGESVKQASKEVKSTARVKSLQQKSLKAYGATKGTRMGSEDGSGEAIRDTIAPLTRDQHAKVQAAEREAKAAAKKAAPAAPKKPLSTSQRLSAIAAAVRKAKAKHDVPTMEPDDEGHDDLMDVHQSLHIRSGYNEEVEQVDEGKVAKALAVGAMTLASMGAKAHTDTTKSVAQLAKERPALAQRLKDIGAEGQVPASDVRAAELQKKQDQEMPASERRAKELEELEKMKEEVNLQEEPKDQADVGEYDYEGDMAKSQLRSILANAKRLHDMLEENTNLPEWVQSKITLAQDYILTAASYMEGEMNEEVEQIDERNKLNKSRKDTIARQIAAHAVIGSEVPYDMIHSPLRSGRKIMRNVTSARASQLYRKLPNPINPIKKEEVEQMDEVSKNLRFDASAPLQTTAPVVKMWRMSKKGNPKAKAAWAKHVRRIQKVEPTGMTKQDIEDHMQSNFGEETGADKRDAGYKMTPAVRKAQGESDKLSKPETKYQAGTLAANAIRRAMEKELKYNPRYRTEEKTERALKLAVNAAKTTKNKMVNVNPQLNGIKDNSNNGR